MAGESPGGRQRNHHVGTGPNPKRTHSHHRQTEWGLKQGRVQSVSRSRWRRKASTGVIGPLARLAGLGGLYAVTLFHLKPLALEAAQGPATDGSPGDETRPSRGR